MKIRFVVAMLSTGGALSVDAAYTGPQNGYYSFTVEGGSTLRNDYSQGEGRWGNTIDNTTGELFSHLWSGSWDANLGFTNKTVSGGSAFFSASAEQSPRVNIHIRDNVNGYIASVMNNNYFTDLSDPAIGPRDLRVQGTGIIVVDPGKTFSSSKRAVMLYDNNNNNWSQGTWNITGGTWRGGKASEAVLARRIDAMTLDSASFYAGSGNGHGVSAVAIEDLENGLFIIRNSRTNSLVFKASNIWSVEREEVFNHGGSGVWAPNADISGNNAEFIGSQVLTQGDRLAFSRFENLFGQNAYANGGSGALIEGLTTLNGTNYIFRGGRAGDAIAAGNAAIAHAYGGHGASFATGNGAITDSAFTGARAGTAEIITAEYILLYDENTKTATGARAYAHGGSGLKTGSGSFTLNNTDASGAEGGQAIANYENNYADASGGNGVYSTGNLTINGGTYVGGRGGIANADKGEAYAFGGNGVYSTGNVIINDGTFQGATGGSASGLISNDDDGNGVRVIGGNLEINGGTFEGAGSQNAGIWIEDGNLTITESVADTDINGNLIMFQNAGQSNTASIQAGSVSGDIWKLGEGTVDLSINENASYSGTFLQEDGTVNVNLSSTNESKFFTNVQVDRGNLTFKNETVFTTEGAVFTLGSTNSTLTFEQGADLSNQTQINAGFSDIASSGGSVTMGEGSAIAFLYDGATGARGKFDVTGSSFTMDDHSRLLFHGIAAAPTNSIPIVSGGTVAISPTAVIDADLGWLVTETVSVGTSDITVNTEYNSLTNTTLSDLNEAVLLNTDAVILTDTNVGFYTLNAIGEEKGDNLFRYTLSQMPDTGESSIKINQQVHGQIAARGTEFRSMNGFASTKPPFKLGPDGVAGPQLGIDEEQTMQGWIRGYGGVGSRDGDGHFAEYDSAAWGTVIGVDKSFGNLMIGLAGGYGRTDLDAGSAYQADIDVYHGSLYATFGGESFFMDLALTYGWSETAEESLLFNEKGEFDSQMYSAYIGAGYAFDIGEKLALTPEASFLTSLYQQDEYTRNSLLGNGTVTEYDTASLLGTIGVNLATQHQIDWLNRGIAYLPEIRVHYIHEFDADPDDFTYIVGGTPADFAVRPRDEHLFRLGGGLDIWSWKHQNAKFEIDYDALISDQYNEHVVSGKATFRF